MPVRAHPSESDSDNDDELTPRDKLAVGVAGRAADAGACSDSSDADSDDSDSGVLPYIVDVAAVSASLALSMLDKGVQRTDAAKRAMAERLRAESEAAAVGEDERWKDDADEEAADELTLQTSHTASRHQLSEPRLGSTGPLAATPASTALHPTPTSRAVSPALFLPLHLAAMRATAWPVLSSLAPLPQPLSRPSTPFAAASGGVTCRPAVLRPNTATARTPRPATACASSPSFSSSSDLHTTTADTTLHSSASSSHRSSRLSPRMSSLSRPFSVAGSEGPSMPSSLAAVDSLLLPVDYAGASELTSSRRDILRGSFLSAARERRKARQQRQVSGQEHKLLDCHCSAAVTESGDVGRSEETAYGAVNVSRASTAPCSTSDSLSSAELSSYVSSPSASSSRVSPRSPVSPIAFSVRSRAASSSSSSSSSTHPRSARPATSASSAPGCVFPIHSVGMSQRMRQRATRAVH